MQGPLKEAFAPKPRNKLERALTVPGAYLACECCEPVERSLSNTQPATSILYQLYLESGTLVNIADLWAAFEAVMSDEQDDANVMGKAVESTTRSCKYIHLRSDPFTKSRTY